MESRSCWDVSNEVVEVIREMVKVVTNLSLARLDCSDRRLYSDCLSGPLGAGLCVLIRFDKLCLSVWTFPDWRW